MAATATSMRPPPGTGGYRPWDTGRATRDTRRATLLGDGPGRRPARLAWPGPRHPVPPPLRAGVPERVPDDPGDGPQRPGGRGPDPGHVRARVPGAHALPPDGAPRRLAAPDRGQHGDLPPPAAAPRPHPAPAPLPGAGRPRLRPERGPHRGRVGTGRAQPEAAGRRVPALLSRLLSRGSGACPRHP